MNICVGIDLGATRIKAAAFVSRSGRLLSRKTVPTRDGEAEDGAPAWAAGVRSVVAEWEDEFEEAVGAIGLASPGLVSRDQRTVAFMPGRLNGLEGFDWTEFMGRTSGIPVVNDAHAALLGEVWQGAGRGLADVILLTLGTGVGGAILAGGRLLSGHIGRAGHLGHVSLYADGVPDIVRTPGSLEDAIGECTLDRRTAGRFSTTRQLLEAIEAGEAGARLVWEKSVRDLAVGITSLINALDPEAVVIGGGIAQAGEGLFGPLRAQLDQFEWRPGGHRVAILPAQLGEWAGAYGAARLGLQWEERK
jgi:glucokinase